jgi:hypothetical protein
MSYTRKKVGTGEGNSNEKGNKFPMEYCGTNRGYTYFERELILACLNVPYCSIVGCNMANWWLCELS